MKTRTFIVGAALLLGMFGCSEASGVDEGKKGTAGQSGKTEEEVLQLCSWWTAPGPADALRALTDTYQETHEGARVYHYSDITASTFRDVMNAHIEEPMWDVFQLAAADLSWLRTGHPGAVAELDSLYAEAGLDGVMLPEIKNAIMADGHAYGVVTGVHRNNAFIYSKQIFNDQKLAPPTSVAEFLEVSAALKAAGVTPVATSMDTWVLRIMFEEILAGTMSAERFHAFVKGEATGDDAEVRADIQSAIDVFETVLTEYIDVEKSSGADYHWPNAAQDLHDGNAAMFMHGDWAKGYLLHLGWTAGVDFDVLGPPGASDLFIYGADMLGMPSSAPHPELARNFLAVIASPEGQVAFNQYKGSTPMRTDIGALLDAPTKASLDDLVNAKVLMASRSNAAWDAGISAFAKDHDKDALLAAYADAP